MEQEACKASLEMMYSQLGLPLSSHPHSLDCPFVIVFLGFLRVVVHVFYFLAIIHGCAESLASTLDSLCFHQLLEPRGCPKPCSLPIYGSLSTKFFKLGPKNYKKEN